MDNVVPPDATVNTVDIQDPSSIASEPSLDQSSSLFDVIRPGPGSGETTSTGIRQDITVESGPSFVAQDADQIIQNLFNDLFSKASRVAPDHLECSCPVVIAWWETNESKKKKHFCSLSQVHTFHLSNIASTKTSAEAMYALSTRLPKSSGRWSIRRGEDAFLLYAGTANEETAIASESQRFVVKSWVTCRFVKAV